MNNWKLLIVLATLSISAVSAAMTSEMKSPELKVIIDGRYPSEIKLPNIASNITIWEVGNSFIQPKVEFEEYNEFKFIKWVQLMLCSGGSETRDLFQHPLDRDILNDYDFIPLVKNCEGILAQGAKPYLKLGAVPLKFTKDPKISDSGHNIYPPDSYEEYYSYIKALVEKLVDRFGKEEVLSWRFGCFDEYENGKVFRARNGDPEDSFIAYCKLYDYTAQALTDVLGEEVFIGAHSMSVLNGLWDERRFIDHVANGINYANGKIGTKLSSLSVSFYDNGPGNLSLNTLGNIVKPLQDKARECGLDDLVYGVDEGRILAGTNGMQSANLNSRATGYLWQAAEDARLFSQAIELNMDYFSAWNYLTGGNFTGFPTVSYHVAHNFARFDGYNKIDINYPLKKNDNKDIGCIAGVKEDTVRIMIYNFSTDINSREIENLSLKVLLPFNKRKVKLIKWLIDDDCNYFDEWIEDRKKYNISSDAFLLSPEDGQVEARSVLYGTKSRELYFNKLRGKYIKCSKLSPISFKAKTNNGVYSEELELKSNNVLFIQITK